MSEGAIFFFVTEKKCTTHVNFRPKIDIEPPLKKLYFVKNKLK